jgi:hypothetical protein
MMASGKVVEVMIVLLTLVIVLAYSRQQIVVYFPSLHSRCRCSPDRAGVQRSGSVSAGWFDIVSFGLGQMLEVVVLIASSFLFPRHRWLW